MGGGVKGILCGAFVLYEYYLFLLFINMKVYVSVVQTSRRLGFVRTL